MANSYHSWRTGIQIDNLYPVGSIYISVNATNPGSLFGGTWELIQDTFLLAAGNTYVAGDTGGTTSHKHTHAHTHTTNATTTGGTSLSTANLPAHTHGSKSLSGSITFRTYSGSDRNLMMGTSGIISRSIDAWSGAHDELAVRSMNPAKTNVMTVNATHEHSSVGSGTAHSHTQVATTSNGANTNDTSTENHIPPYLVVYMWQRIT